MSRKHVFLTAWLLAAGLALSSAAAAQGTMRTWAGFWSTRSR